MDAKKVILKSDKISFLILVRGMACLLVVWDHLIGIWTAQYKINFIPIVLVRQYITKPLGIIQDFGYLGVVLFFFVSGFVISHVAQRENRRDFIIKRLFRIYPPFIISVVAIVLFHHAYDYYASMGYSLGAYLRYDQSIPKLGWLDIGLAMTLLNYLKVHQNPVNGVAWTLVIEMIFYVLCFFTLSLVQKSPRIATLILLGICFAILFMARNFGAHFFLLSASVSYIPLLLIGQATYFLWSKRFGPYWFVAILAANYIVFMYGVVSIHNEFYPPENSYGISTVYGYAIFVLLLLLNNYLQVHRLTSFYSNISYSLYLYHGLIGFAVLGILYPFTGYIFALAAAFGASSGVAYLSWHYVEVPSQELARRFLKRFARAAPLVQPLGNSAE